MAAMDLLLFLLSSSFIFCVHDKFCHASKLNVPKLLLPYYSHVAANFTLEASDGCFIWHSSRPEVASVRPLGTSSCSRTAVVTSVSTVKTRRTTVITANESVTGQELRCDVIVDEITQITIETTTKELFLDDSPEEFIIRASNDKGDMFSSLDGMLFDWSLVSDADSGEQNAANVLRLLKFSESSYTALPHIKHMEENGKRGDRILMKGLQTGGAIVSVKPVDPAYRHLPEFTVRVLVVANLQLSPSVVYILPHLTVTYKVELLKQGKAHEVKMPSKQYSLELDNTTVATLDSKTSTVTGIDFGFAELKLKDLTFQPSDTQREPSAGIYVVNPAYLEFSVNPDPSWLLETNRTYVVCVNVFDGDNNKIYPTKNLRVAAVFPDRHFHVISSTPNGTYHVVQTMQKGFANLYAQLKSITTSNGKKFSFEKAVEGNQAVEIFDPIVLLPERVILPWEASRNIQFQFKVSGGSGNYSWHSANPSAADVQPTGLVTVGSTIGSITIKASDVRNAAHFDTSQVVVVPPSRLMFLASKVEAEIGSSLRLPITLFGELDKKEVSFDDCHTIELNIQLSENNIFRKKSIVESTTEHACADVLLEAVGVGHIEVAVAYEIGRINLRASQVVAAYSPLTIFQPKEVAVVTLGSSLEIVFEGGPRPWVLDASGFFQTASFEKEKLVAVGKPRISDAFKHHHSVNIRCMNFGEQMLTLTVGNKPTAKNLYPATSVAKIIYACETPKGLHLFPSIEHPANLPPCPISAEFDDPVPVPIETDVLLVATLTDRLGRRFGNFSSLVFDWTVSDSKLGKFSDRLPLDGNAWTTHMGYKWISLSGSSGLLTVTVRIAEYNPRFVESWFTSRVVNPPIVMSRILQLVGYPKFSHPQVIMFNHAQVKASINIIDGSGHYKVDQNERASEIATINYNHRSNLTVVPISEGSVVLSVADLCLSPLQLATTTIFVSDIAQIVLQVVDKVELHFEVEVSVKILDGNNLPIDSSYFSMMDVQPVSLSDIISVRQSTNSKGVDRLTTMYTVRGESLGRAFLQVSAVSKMGHKIMSPAKEIQVFPPLHLKPKNITIIPGTFFQVMAFGGPEPESTIEFTIKNEAVATVTNEGLITAVALGSTKIIAMATGLDASNSSRVVFSQDYAVIDVVELTEVRIVTPLKRIQAGTQMPVYAIGLNENVTPFSFANVDPPLEFRWLIANDQVALLRPVYHERGVDMSDEGNFAVRFHALSSGQVTVNLVVTSLNGKVATMKDSVMIQVFDQLTFLSPPISDGVILMMPSTQMFVKTNRDGSNAQLSYAVVDPDNSYTDRRPPIVSVSRSGLLTAGGYPGQAHLRVTAQEEFAVNHTMVILVKVKPLSYIMINTDTVIRTRAPGLSSFPIGTVINFIVSLHDNVGEQFHATQSTIHYQLNKYDQIQMLYEKTNNSMVVRANSAGFTVLKVYESSNPQITDYIGIPVDSAIQPNQAHVTLGTVVCFSSNLMTQEGHKGEWMSTGNGITIDRSSGVAFANKIGPSSVTYNVSYVVTQTSLKVVPITSISLKTLGPLTFMTNVVTNTLQSSPSIQVIVENTELNHRAGIQGTNCSEMIQAHELSDISFPFSCGIAFTNDSTLLDIKDVASVARTLDPVTGQYICNVTVLVKPALHSVIATFITDVKLYANTVAQEGQPELASKPLVLPFHPAFFIKDAEIILTVNQATVNMKVLATEPVREDIQAISNNTKLVRVRPAHFQSDGTLYFPVDLQLTSHMWNSAPTVVNLTVSCSLTGQKQTVIVVILRSDQAEMSWGHLVSALLHRYSNLFFLIICLIATFSCMIIAYNLVYVQRNLYPGSSAASAAFLSSSAFNRSPLPYSPVSYSSQSPPSSSTSPQRRWTANHSPYSNGHGQGTDRRSSGLDKSF